jgi:hypothetical protein
MLGGLDGPHRQAAAAVPPACGWSTFARLKRWRG